MIYAIETLEIEKSRLIKAIRELRSLPVSGDDYPTGRIDEHKQKLEELERSISFLEREIENQKLRWEQQLELSKEAMKKYQSLQGDPATKPGVDDKSS
jgi:dynactin complex subunit